MTLINLTAEERDRFASWLEQEAETDRGFLVQMEKLDGMTPFIQKRKNEIVAALMVARKLRSIEDWGVNP